METANTLWEKHHSEIIVSIIIPSFNKYPLNLITLYSLEKQRYDMDKMEVIFIDDASTDHTIRIRERYKPPYPFRYIQLQENVGRSKIRNIGVEKACGSLIIFLDAEMMVEPDFVLNHWQAHENEDRLVLTGGFHLNRVYTCIFPDFNGYQSTSLANCMYHDKLLYDRYMDYKKKEKSDEAYCLLFNKKEIDEQMYKKYASIQSTYFNRIAKDFGEGLAGFNFPWMSFLTGDVSLKKDFFYEAGGFDEDFVVYGYEDWELGYRLYKLNAKFLAKENVKAYHQEHPISDKNWGEAMNNYSLFVKKHPDPDIFIMGLEMSRMVSLYQMNRIIKEYRMLLKEYPNEYLALKEGLGKILDTIVILLRYDIRHKSLLDASGIEKPQIEQIRLDLEKLKVKEGFRGLVHLFEKKFLKD